MKIINNENTIVDLDKFASDDTFHEERRRVSKLLVASNKLEHRASTNETLSIILFAIAFAMYYIGASTSDYLKGAITPNIVTIFALGTIIICFGFVSVIISNNLFKKSEELYDRALEIMDKIKMK